MSLQNVPIQNLPNLPSMMGKENRDQQKSKKEYRAFYPSKDSDSGIECPINPGSPGNRSNDSTSQSERCIIDLDLIVEKYLLYMWEVTKSKSDKKYDFEDLDIVFNWNKVEFTQEEAKFESKNSGKQAPVNQTLFKTYFTNKTNQVQEYSFKTERTTRQSCAFSFLNGFSREKGGNCSLKLPYEILEIGSGMRSEQSVEYGKDQTKEEEIKWGCDSMIKVSPHSKTGASLVITELQMERDFTMTTYIKGRLIATLNHKKEGFVKSISGEIAQILKLANEKLWLPPNSSKFEVVMINGEKVVKSSMNGKCNFRLGVQQHIEINEEIILS